MNIFEVSGTGPVVVLLHGFPNNARLWEKATVPRDAHLVTLEVCGEEPLARLIGDMAALVESLKSRFPAQAIHLVGHDLGCFIVNEVSLRVPALVASQMLINGAGIAQFASRIGLLRQWRASYYVPLFNAPLLPRLVRMFLTDFCTRLVYDRSGIDADSVLRLPAYNNFGPIGLYRELSRCAVAMMLSPAPRERCQVPTIQVSGDRDPFLVAPSSAELARFFTRATHVTLSGGHWLPVTHAAAISQILTSIIAPMELTA